MGLELSERVCFFLLTMACQVGGEGGEIGGEGGAIGCQVGGEGWEIGGERGGPLGARLEGRDGR